MVTLWKTTEDQGISFISQSSLTMAGQQESNVKNCVFSTDGKLWPYHQGTKDSGNDQHFYVWECSKRKVMSASFKSPAFLTVECCCLSSKYKRAYLVREFSAAILVELSFAGFLKVNRYLISYGVDGMVFLWDISESKAVGFATIVQGNESIVSMAVSPEEDKVVLFYILWSSVA
ncbi:hypothetical protein OS493_040123 [Desmophyllum pertusum]|uniref:Uncharacterized protein n=1 Tax=Desmophyllum pertusum TaxID=174260 RepID=A0A9W9Y9P0_9CNID|nr:hypothetical protein OS493_040123 [Desmophyllum pertusum]